MRKPSSVTIALMDATRPSPERLKEALTEVALSLGFDDLRVAAPDLHQASARLREWLDQGFHGDMEWLQRHAALRANPAALHPGTVRVVSVRMPYLPESPGEQPALTASADKPTISRYALGRDYHAVLRQRLQQLASRLEALAGPFRYRVFTDSAPVMEVEIARQCGLGWRGKHTLLLSRQGGSFFFLGEMYTDLPLPVDAPVDEHCGDCQACIDICPTQAIIGPYRLDARRCISYLTIELKGSIPEDLRPLMGNRIYGCDDCQLACPWNRFARISHLADFKVRPPLDTATLVELLGWSEVDFLERLAGSAIRRIGHERWLRNLAVALGNGPATPEARAALASRLGHPSPLVREHVNWALTRLSE
jgi:epoxyqueuosine reductase